MDWNGELMCKKPCISIVLPVYNGEKFLQESLDSIMSQSFQNWELIIVDDCSTDKSPQIMDEYASCDDRIRIIHNSTNKKLPESLNVGFSNACGEFYSWTSDDNIYYSNAFEEMIGYMNFHPDSPMVVADMDLIDENGQVIGEWNSFDKEELYYRNGVGACFLYRAAVAKSVGKYDKSLFLVEDYDYWLRLLTSYGEISHINNSLYGFRVHEDSLSESRKEAVKKQLFLMRSLHLKDLIPALEKREDLIFRMYCEMLEVAGLSQEQMSLFSKYSFVMGCIENYNGSKQSVIYGAGKYGIGAANIISDVLFFVDKNQDIIGRTINGIEVISIEDLKSIESEYQLVVALHHDKLFSALKELNEYGFGHFCIIQDVLRKKRIGISQFNEEIKGTI